MKKTILLLILVLCGCESEKPSVSEPKPVEPPPPGERAGEEPGKINIGTYMVNGQPLSFWVSNVSYEMDEDDRVATVKALVSALNSDDVAVRVDAADALATLGPMAKEAMPALIEQLTHEVSWVRAAASGAMVSMGKEAVPHLIETFKTGELGPRVRSAFALGAIGPDAIEAAPVIAADLQKENEVIRARYLGILGQIDPENYPPLAGASTARFDPAEAGQPAALTPDAMASQEWPQFHGPGRDALCRETGLLQTWPEEGPKQLWVLHGLGRGLSNVSIANGKIYTMGDRAAEGQPEERQVVMAYDLQTRDLVWATPFAPPFKDYGPRCTPTVDGDSLYVIGTEGDLVCLDAATGEVRWRKNFVKDFGGKMMSKWKYCESPLIDGENLICTPGGAEATLVALNKQNGQTVWQCAVPELGERGADGAGYASAVAAEIAGVRQIVQLCGRGVVGVEAQTGKFLWGYNRIANNVANIPTPIVRGNYVFVTTAYNTGAALLKIVREGDSFEAREVYFIKSKEFQNHHGGVVLVGDYLYGGHNTGKGDPTCIDLATGAVVWREKAPALGSAGLLYADGRLIFRYDRGDVVLVEATPKAFRVKGRFRAPVGEGPAWAHPVVHQGRLYLRHADILSCYDLRALR